MLTFWSMLIHFVLISTLSTVLITVNPYVTLFLHNKRHMRAFACAYCLLYMSIVLTSICEGSIKPLKFALQIDLTIWAILGPLVLANKYISF